MQDHSCSPLAPASSRLDIVDVLRSAGLDQQRLLELDRGQTLAQWQNRKGQVHYERPRHHVLSIYTSHGDRASRLVNGHAVSRGFSGAVCLLPAGSRSTWGISGQFEFVHLYFNDRDLAQCTEQTWDCEPGHLQLQERYHAEDPLLAQAGQLLAMTDWQAPGQALAMEHLAQWLLVQVVSRHAIAPRATPEVRGQLSRRYRRLLEDRIDAELDQPLTLATLAGWVNLSPYHFARLFRATFGCAPYQYIQEQRLLRARRLLQAPGSKITAVGLACGFGDPSQFSRAFRKRFGATPSQYRMASGRG